MIVADRKPIEEIIEQVKGLRSVLVLGCNECVTVCEAGGKKEVGVLASALRMYFLQQGREVNVGERTLERQCDTEYLEEIRDSIDHYEAVVSLACGVGIQFTAEFTPTETLLLDTPGYARDVVLQGDYAYVAADDNGLQVIDRWPLSAMSIVGGVDALDRSLALVVVGDLLYLADGDAGLRIIDITDADSPVELAVYPLSGTAVDVAVSGDLAFVAVQDKGVSVIHIADPERPLELAFIDTLGSARGVAVDGEALYVADGQGGLLIYSLPPAVYTFSLPLVLK